jgi:hypothetical protein
MMREAEEVILEERARVLKLTKIVEEFSPRLLDVMKLSLEGTLATTLRHINLTSHFHETSLNLTRLTKSTKSMSSALSTSSDTRRSVRDRKQTINKMNSIPDTGPPPPTGSTGALLLSWMNNISKTLSGLTVTAESGHTLLLDDYLPPFQEIRSLETLKHGQQIDRVVFRLVAQSLSKTPSLLGSSSRVGGVRRMESNSPERKITLEKMNQLKESLTSPRDLYGLLFGYLQAFFRDSPVLPLDGILSGRVESIEILLSELLFLWSGLGGHVLTSDERTEVQKLTEKQQKHLEEVDRFIEEIRRSKLFHFGLKEENHGRAEEKKEESALFASVPAGDASNPIPTISFDISSSLSESVYEGIVHQIDDYFKKSPDQLFNLLTEFMTEIQAMNDFANTVFLKEKQASTGLQYLIDTQRAIALNSLRHVVVREETEGEHTSSSSNSLSRWMSKESFQEQGRREEGGRVNITQDDSKGKGDETK